MRWGTGGPDPLEGARLAIKTIGVLYPVVAALNLVANLIREEVEWLSLLRAIALIVFVILAVTAGLRGREIGGVFGVWPVVLVAALGGLAIGQSESDIAGIIVAVNSALLSKRATHATAPSCAPTPTTPARSTYPTLNPQPEQGRAHPPESRGSLGSLSI